MSPVLFINMAIVMVLFYVFFTNEGDDDGPGGGKMIPAYQNK